MKCGRILAGLLTLFLGTTTISRATATVLNKTPSSLESNFWNLVTDLPRPATLLV